MKGNRMTKQQFRDVHPVRMVFSTGKYGWERLGDALNLRRCIFRTRRAAEMDRALAYRVLAERDAEE